MKNLILLSKNLFKYFLMFLLLQGFMSCGIGEEERGTSTDELDDREYLMSLYTPLQGVYEGSLVNERTRVDFPVRISIFITEYNKAIDDDGEPIYLVKPAGWYRKMEDPGEYDDQLLDIKYIRETGEIILTSANVLNAEGSYIYIHGFFKDGKLTDCQLTKGRGIVGTFFADKVSDKAYAPSEDMETEKRKLFREMLEPLVGTYRGRVIGASYLNNNGTFTTEDYDVLVRVYMVEEYDGVNANGEARFLPGLRARFRNVELPSGIIDYFLIVRYYPATNVVSMRTPNQNEMSPKPIPGAGFFSVTGTWQGDTINADLASHQGPAGKMKVKKVRVQ